MKQSVSFDFVKIIFNLHLCSAVQAQLSLYLKARSYLLIRHLAFDYRIEGDAGIHCDSLQCGECSPLG